MTLPPARDLRLYERRVFLRRVGIALINTLFQMDGRLFHQREDLLKRLRCLLVIEHIGKFLEPVPPHPGFQSLLRLADSGRCWVKLSGAYMLSTAGPPYYPDIGVLAHTRCSGVAPEHLVWASNWPHPLPSRTVPPDDAVLLDWVPDEKIRNDILAVNPARLYGFPVM